MWGVAEADWADAAQLSAWVTGRVKGRVEQALSGFERFPTWMWRNASTSSFAEWLCDYNRGRAKRVGIYGLDLYGLGRSMLEVLAYIDKVDPQRALVALDNSFELEMHTIGMPACAVRFSNVKSDPTTRMLTRYIGVVYRPETERMSHYLWAQWARMFDAVVHVDSTSAVVPLGGRVEATKQPRDGSALQG